MGADGGPVVQNGGLVQSRCKERPYPAFGMRRSALSESVLTPSLYCQQISAAVSFPHLLSLASGLVFSPQLLPATPSLASARVPNASSRLAPCTSQRPCKRAFPFLTCHSLPPRPYPYRLVPHSSASRRRRPTRLELKGLQISSLSHRTARTLHIVPFRYFSSTMTPFPFLSYHRFV